MWSHIWLRAALALPFLKSISPEYFFPPTAFSHMLVLLPLSSFWHNPPVEKTTGQEQWSCYSGKAPPPQGGSQPQRCLLWRRSYHWSYWSVHVGSTRTLLYMPAHGYRYENFVWELEDSLQPPPLTHGSFVFEGNDLSQDAVQKALRNAFLTHLFFLQALFHTVELQNLFLLQYFVSFTLKKSLTICVPATGVALFNNNYLKYIFCKIIF